MNAFDNCGTDKYFNEIPDDSRVKTDGRYLKEAYVTEEVVKKAKKLNIFTLKYLIFFNIQAILSKMFKDFKKMVIFSKKYFSFRLCRSELLLYKRLSLRIALPCF